MVCNTGVSLTPVVNGEVHHFESRGLYDGLSVLWDEETETLWNHLTGDAMTGDLKGETLGPPHNLWQTTVEAALDAYPDVEVALSERPIRRRGRPLDPNGRRGGLSRMFQRTIAQEDSRRETMDIGIGLWAEDNQTAKYYPMETLAAADNAIIDAFNGRRVLVYYAPRVRALRAIYSPASSVRWEGDDLHLSTGHVLRNGVMYDAADNPVEIEAPLQVFTRWYGFSLTFPETEIWRP